MLKAYLLDRSMVFSLIEIIICKVIRQEEPKRQWKGTKMKDKINKLTYP